nr:hypothetical protein Iba_scaffold66483CG0010 [Ipomoea batatas]GMD85611.1 hypothetical protein Iba_chr14aCG26040 [Ipomoea batatas]GME19686.1 hypothetical protein Iba_scaffold23504CG0040 [Ipomoea batatas]
MLLSNTENESSIERSDTASATSFSSVNKYPILLPNARHKTQKNNPTTIEVDTITLIENRVALASPLPSSFATRRYGDGNHCTRDPKLELIHLDGKAKYEVVDERNEPIRNISSSLCNGFFLSKKFEDWGCKDEKGEEDCQCDEINNP